SGSAVSSSITRVFTTLFSGTPIDADEWLVPPCSTYSNSCSVYLTPCLARNAVAGVFAISAPGRDGAHDEAHADEDHERADHAAHLLLGEPHLDAPPDGDSHPHEGREHHDAGRDGEVKQQPRDR